MSSCFYYDAGLAAKTVLAAGAGGSIGSALAERIMGGLAGTLLLLDKSQAKLEALRFFITLEKAAVILTAHVAP